jgi:hypothetical protein
VEIPDTLDFLTGTWSLDRLIHDYRSRTRGSFVGTAIVAVTEPKDIPARERRANYDETGELCFGSHSGRAARHLNYTSQPGSGAVTILFPNGRTLADLDLRDGRSRSVHNCHPDRYEFTTIVRSQGEVEEHWHVRGPTTSYDAVTTLIRRDHSSRAETP